MYVLAAAEMKKTAEKIGDRKNDGSDGSLHLLVWFWSTPAEGSVSAKDRRPF